jgi:Cu+-exporting ATPase
VRVGTRAWLRQGGVEVGHLEPHALALAEAGRTPLFAALDGAPAALLGVQDVPAAEARDTVHELRRLGLRVALLSGDRAEVARSVAVQVGLSEVHAPARPEEKAALVARLRAEGRVVAMVGDGVNDAPALAGAHVGIALGHGTDIAAAAADIVLLRGGLRSLPLALRLARATRRTIRRNLFWAFAYNAVAIPVAAGVLVPFGGPGLSPVLASAAMALSSVSVLASSLRLRRFGVEP